MESERRSGSRGVRGGEEGREEAAPTALLGPRNTVCSRESKEGRERVGGWLVSMTGNFQRAGGGAWGRGVGEGRGGGGTPDGW